MMMVDYTRPELFYQINLIPVGNSWPGQFEWIQGKIFSLEIVIERVREDGGGKESTMLG